MKTRTLTIHFDNSFPGDVSRERMALVVEGDGWRDTRDLGSIPPGRVSVDLNIAHAPPAAIKLLWRDGGFPRAAALDAGGRRFDEVFIAWAGEDGNDAKHELVTIRINPQSSSLGSRVWPFVKWR